MNIRKERNMEELISHAQRIFAILYFLFGEGYNTIIGNEKKTDSNSGWLWCVMPVGFIGGAAGGKKRR